MKLRVNGEEHEHKGAGTVTALLDELKAEPARSAVLLNDDVVPRAAFATARLKPGDRLEILTLMGGG
jgi:thiamine biosynthesis protein ThiS